MLDDFFVFSRSHPIRLHVVFPPPPQGFESPSKGIAPLFAAIVLASFSNACKTNKTSGRSGDIFFLKKNPQKQLSQNQPELQFLVE